MYKKYCVADDYKNDLDQSIKLISDCMYNLQQDVMNCVEIKECYMNSATSAGLSYLLKKLNINSDILANRLRYTDGLVKSCDVEYEKYYEITNGILAELNREKLDELKKCRNKVFNAEFSDILNLNINKYFLEVYLYIIKNIFLESFIYTCNKKKEENLLLGKSNK